MTAVKSSRDWSHLPHTHSAAFAQNITPSAQGAVLFQPSSRGVVFDQSGTVQLEMAGVVNELPNPVVGVSGDISAAANGVFTSTTSNKFSSFAVNDTIIITGFSNKENNGTFEITAAAAQSITVRIVGPSQLVPGTIPETPAGTAVSIQDQTKTSVQSIVTTTVIAGVLYPYSIDQWITGGSGVSTGTIFW